MSFIGNVYGADAEIKPLGDCVCDICFKKSGDCGANFCAKASGDCSGNACWCATKKK